MSARILIVEDEQIIAADLRNKLVGLGHEIVGMAIAGAEAISIAEQVRPDLVLMDVQLEGAMSGTEAARTIQKHTGARDHLHHRFSRRVPPRSSANDRTGNLFGQAVFGGSVGGCARGRQRERQSKRTGIKVDSSDGPSSHALREGWPGLLSICSNSGVRHEAVRHGFVLQHQPVLSRRLCMYLAGLENEASGIKPVHHAVPLGNKSEKRILDVVGLLYQYPLACVREAKQTRRARCIRLNCTNTECAWRRKRKWHGILSPIFELALGSGIRVCRSLVCEHLPCESWASSEGCLISDAFRV